uniref:Uncharacterized protein n=1 Tax=Chlamydomonas leiostraca TaxID=1034604 RepID=A0A7S0RQA9_9CHLO|mmetsp:Transcript_28885/g.73742  ORF Transcript_28885/g.73742 Transcript_28885/m.73742 type:complete len:310 (+) Transcript_28885:157-1086(+)|eukprot:CAMPEP_0202865316 /NCGR_PEP_ID=MMETSP1391-20130828/5654_1 /ASSEMBLY_ACC=CAM_ASM_000867 /TAXON_ID=1034604 /ORGANISM="Chlamydomonas leiostraca, Strain SAG 11-49" /LENGTH=309 /DNA_ID=CAMNT_0049545141 /DNA_START=150 /DNA_END=1079 /DNA_ORIENTATION=+
MLPRAVGTVASKPGLASLLEGALSDGCVKIAASAAAAAIAAPSIAHIVAPVVLADAALASSSFSFRRPLLLAEPDTGELKSILSVFHPRAILQVLAKNVGVSALVRFNIYMVELLDHENRAHELEAQGQAVPEPPSFPDMGKQAVIGAKNAVRELAVRLVRRVYEHAAVWRLGARRAEPFLRDAVAWIAHVLAPMHRSLPTAARATKYGFAMLHGNALFYAADCTVASAIQLHGLREELRRKQPLKAAGTVARVVVIQVVRCGTVLVVTSVFAALGSLAKPGIGTKIGWLGTDHLTNHMVWMLVKKSGI